MKYIITADVKEARGFQQFEVEADSEEEAKKKHLNGESEFVDEEVEVTQLSDDVLVECAAT